jgi:thiol-disulfide isomerase/thioredoxin
MIARLRIARTAVIAAALFVGATTSLHAQDSSVGIGATAPSATVHTLDGKPVDLAKVAKGPAVIEFWATWCENCEHLLPAMQKAHATYGKRVKFVAVAVGINQSVNRVKLHVAKHKVPGDQYFDTKGDATGKWDVPATSYVVVLDKNGKIVYTGVGGDQNIDAAIKKAL